VVATGDREAMLRTYMADMPPEWYDGMRHGPQWPLFERMAPTVEADAEALAWTQSVAEVPGTDHGWEPEAMAEVLATDLRG
jgi:hypothetical protein